MTRDDLIQVLRDLPAAFVVLAGLIAGIWLLMAIAA